MKNSNLGERIRAVRGSVSRAAFGKRIGITSGSLRNYEEGAALPNAEVLAKICERCDVSADWLLLGIGPMLANRAESSLPTGMTENSPEDADLSTVPAADRAGACARCDELWAELRKEMEAFRKTNEQLIRMDLVNEAVRMRNAALEEEIRALRDRILSLERENVRLLATRNAEGKPKKRSGHVDSMTLVSAPPRLQEHSDSFPGDVFSGEQ